MNTIFLVVLIISMLVVFGVDAARKRDRYLRGE